MHHTSSVHLTDPSVKFKRVVCPADITSKTGCVRDDDKVLAGSAPATAAASLAVPPSTMAMFAALLLGLISL